jgi:peptidyl-Asp metalloendopeptidase
MSSLINLMVSETNTSYSNSGVTPRVRRVHAVEVSYAETGNLSTDLSRLRSTTDGYMDNVHSLRNTYKADLVGLITESGSACGVGYLMTTVSTSFATNGFSVTKRSCATGNYSFGHELGHNMGAHHDAYVTSSSGAYSYSYGYVYLPGKWRTVMAYNNGCSAVGVSCTRIAYWSNPDKFYNGVATGVSSTAPNAADNRRTLNNTAYTVANFRASQ